jgi:iron complex outermembrane receptor protein
MLESLIEKLKPNPMSKFYHSFRKCLVLLMMLAGFSALAQRAVTGKVTSSDDGSPIPGVNVQVKGTNTGTVTDSNGNFSIMASDNNVLVFSFVGYATQEVAVGAQTDISVSLQTDVTALAEVVVIGYGEIRRTDATGSLASVKSEEFNKGLIAGPEQLFQGKAAGVQVVSSTGEPGAGINIRIRGTSSVRNGNNPLFVVDGIPLSGDDVTPGGADLGRGTQSPRNPLNFLNPSDIQSVDILKDASATAIYGARGANGVVIITTKSGRGAKSQLEYSPTLSISRQAKYYDLLDRDEFLSTIERIGNNATAADLGGSTDWQKEISRTAVSQRHELSYSNTLKSGNYRASLSYENQNGVIRNTSMERITGRLNGNYSLLGDKLKIGAQLTYGRVNDEYAAITENAGFEGDLLGSAYMANPTWPGYADSQFPGDVANPLAWLKYYQDNAETDRYLINVTAGYDIMDNLNFKLNLGRDNSSSVRESAISPSLRVGNAFGFGRASVSDADRSSNLLEAFFNYTKDLGPGRLNAVLGYSYQEFNRSGINRAGRQFATSDMDGMIAALNASAAAVEQAIGNRSFQGYGYSSAGLGTFFITTLKPNFETIDLSDPVTSTVGQVVGNTYNQTDELQSFFGRANYSINDKYLFTATFRADGSTKFGGNNKYGFFPAFAAAWKLSSEEFIPEFFDDLKLRLGYGVNGNQEIPHNVHQARVRWNDVGIDNGGNVNKPGSNNVAFENSGLKWEQTSQFNAGLDFGFFDGKLSGTIDVYKKVTTDLLIQQVAAQPSPQPFVWKNLDAEVVNKGVELTLNYYAIDDSDVGLNFSVNFARNTNIVENLNPSTVINTGAINGQGLTGAFAQRIANGQPLYAYFLREFGGFNIDASQGGIGQSIYIGGDVQKFVGKSPLPKYLLGFSANFRYKAWDFSAYMNGQFGHYIYNNNANAYFTMGSINSGRNVTSDVIFSGESKSNNPDVSTRFLEKGDFLRLATLSLGYRFNVDGTTIKNLRLFANAQNLFVITDYTGLDPEVSVNKSIDGVPSAGIDYTAYPRARTFSLGLNVTF